MLKRENCCVALGWPCVPFQPGQSSFLGLVPASHPVNQYALFFLLSRYVFPIFNEELFYFLFLENTMILGRKLKNCSYVQVKTFSLENTTILGPKLGNQRRLSSEVLFFSEEHLIFRTKTGKSENLKQICLFPKNCFLLDRLCLTGILLFRYGNPTFNERPNSFTTLCCSE